MMHRLQLHPFCDWKFCSQTEHYHSLANFVTRAFALPWWDQAFFRCPVQTKEQKATILET